MRTPYIPRTCLGCGLVTKPLHGYFLTIGPDPKGRGLLAIISDGTPQMGHDPVTVLSLTVVENEAAARTWFEEVKETRPWESRN